MTPNEIIKELLTRLYLLSPSLYTMSWDELELTSSLEKSRYAEAFPPSNEWLNMALGGEAKALWDMVNESPYTPLETELLQRLQMAWDKCYDPCSGDARYITRACFAPTEHAWLEPLSMSFKDGPPWLMPEAAEDWVETEKSL